MQYARVSGADYILRLEDAQICLKGSDRLDGASDRCEDEPRYNILVGNPAKS